MQSGKRCWIGLIIAIGAMAIVLSSVWSPPLAATQYPREKRRKPTPRTKRQPRTTPVPRRQPPPTTERQPRPNESQQQPPKTSVSPQTVTIELVDIPAGEFTMGSENGNTNEKPVHRVRINYAFKMGKY